MCTKLVSVLYLCIIKCQKQSSAICEEDLHSIVSELPPAFVHLFYLLISPAEGCRLRLSLRNLLIKKSSLSLSHSCVDTHVTQNFTKILLN